MKKKVLVVDDEKLIVKGIRFSLEQEGMEVDCAYDGEEAFRMAKETEYDMILLDVMLPKMNGFEVLRTMREKKILTPVLMLTAKDSDEDIVAGLEAQTGLPNRGTFTRPSLYVLKRTAMPAVLVELGFITNPRDARLMSEQPELFAEGIYRGIKAYTGQ